MKTTQRISSSVHCKGAVVAFISLALLSSSACKGGAASTPTEVIEIQVEAVKNKDMAALKKTFSKKAIKQMEDVGRTRNLKPEDLLSNLLRSQPPWDYLKMMPEIRSENIQGDKATIEIKHLPFMGSSGHWETHKYVREDGEWKEDESPVAQVIS